MHPLLPVLVDAADGRFPPDDGRVEVLAPDDDGTCAVVSFTAHAIVLAEVDAGELEARGADGYGGATHPDVLRWLARPDRHIGSLDVVLVRRAAPGAGLPRRDDLDDHPRVRRARHHRRAVEVYGDADGLVVVGVGLAGRREMSVELFDSSRSAGGAGRQLIAAGLAQVAPGEWCFAQVAPGNAASLRAFLACGFVPIGSEVLITA